MIEQLSFTE